MQRLKQLTVLCGLTVALVMVWPVTAEARPHRPRVVRRAVYARSVVYAPFYWNYAWYGGPWPYWHGGWYDPFYGPWYRPWYGRRYAYDISAVRLEVKPREAQVFVDGYYVGLVDDFDGVFQRLHLPPGGHDIVLHLAGYRNATHRIYLQPNATHRLRHRLEPLPSGAPADPVPAPDPNAPKPDRPGVPRYDPRDRMRDRAPRDPYEPREAEREARFGTVVIHVEPRDAEVFVDGRRWRGPWDDDGISIQLSAGTHRIELRRSGYQTYTTEVNVEPGVTTPLNVMLKEGIEVSP